MRARSPEDWIVPLINKPFALHRDYNKDRNIQALKRRGFLNHGSTLITQNTRVKGSGRRIEALGFEVSQN